MNSRIKTLNQLKDSRLLYDKKVPEIGYLLILSVVALLIIVAIWSTNTPKIDVIKTTGTIQSINKNYVMSPYMGKLTNINIDEGKYVEVGESLFSVTSTEYDLQLEQLLGKQELYQDRINQLEKLILSIKDNENYFDESISLDSLYYYQYESYLTQIRQSTIDITGLKVYGYTDGEIENEVTKNQAKILEIYYSTLKTVEDTILNYQNELAMIEIQLNAVGSGKEEYQVTANATGKIHMLMDYKEGMIIQAGGTIANIASENDQYKIQSFVTTDNIARIEIGDKVDIAIAGLTQTIYGTMSGIITNIDSDVTIDNENNASYFKVDIKPDNNYLISKDGYKVNISNGMAVEARIQYDQVTYFNYLLESLGLLVR